MIIHRDCPTCTCALSDPDADTIGQFHGEAGTDTELLAALEVLPRTGLQRRRVLNAIAFSEDGLTHHEISATTGVRYTSCVPRRRELVLGGWVMDSGRRRSGNGSSSIIWELTPKGAEEFR